ncbi:hypothetical protein FHP25_25015 [Vineibacter terrae]|uniref:Uncharacterized protein n=1 Tax=Vineibacter terrae TaxID=2586908 RepID=A0A5C8PGT3_9HYPH|nr:hypothetical protein [Vineibacter terrae]TXL72560.1 hypothetical protein FHP25_25015 [Vineibacter terrae]
MTADDKLRSTLTTASAAVSIAREVIEERETLTPEQMRSALLSLMTTVAPMIEHAERLQGRVSKLEDQLARTVTILADLHSRLPGATR